MTFHLYFDKKIDILCNTIYVIHYIYFSKREYINIKISNLLLIKISKIFKFTLIYDNLIYKNQSCLIISKNL